MTDENETPDGSEEKQGPQERAGFRERILRYRIPAALVIVFIFAVIVTNSINSSITGGSIAIANSECQQKISDLQRQSADSANIALDNVRLSGQIEDLQDINDLYSSIILGLENEEPEAVDTPFDFKVTWDKYVIAEPRGDLIWSARIENTGSSQETFSLKLELKSAINNAFMKDPSAGSLTLSRKSSGTLDVKMFPEKEGYGIFGIYVNKHYIGDLVVFSIEGL